MARPLWIIHETLSGRGFELVRPPAVYRGSIRVHGTPVRVELEIPDVTFVRLPIVRLLDRSEVPVEALAHLLSDGDICYVGESGLPLDLYDPGGAVLRVLLDAASALERSYGGRAADEFERELASYWRGNLVLFALPKEDGATIRYGEAVRQSDDKEAGIVIIPAGSWGQRRRSAGVPVTVLNFGSNLKPDSHYPMSSLAEAIEYVAGQRPPHGWEEAIISAAAEGHYLFLAAPNAIVGWSAKFLPSLESIRSRPNGFRPTFFRRAVAKAITSVELHRMTGSRVDLHHCVERNLIGRPSLIGKRVALVGCGTIGGYLGRMLVQAGAGCGGNFTLYDIERLAPGNLGRHLLNFDDLGKNKAVALAANLATFHPDVLITPKPADAVADWAELERHDIIIDATGEPNVANALNDAFLRSERQGSDLALVHTWVFGNGVAAQSFLNLKDGGACYRCLKTGFDGNWRHNPLRDPNSELLVAPAHCGEGGYVPFSVDASISAASLSLRALIDWAGGNPGKRLRTQVLDQNAGRDKMPWVSPEALVNCPACGERR